MKGRSAGSTYPRRMLVFCLAVLSLTPVLLHGGEKDHARLSFAIAEGQILKYEASWITEVYFGGMDVTLNESYNVDLSLMKVTEEGVYRVKMAFSDARSSMLWNEEMQDWKPPIQLEGRSIMADIGSNGEILEAKPGGNIPGLRGKKELEDLLERWFIALPDTVTEVGETWRMDIEKRDETKKGEEEAEPTEKGFADITFKKMQKKKGIEVSLLKVKSRVDINKKTPYGVMLGEGEGKGKYYMAIDGGYIVEMKSEFEAKGKLASPDGKETEGAITEYCEIKLKK